ncbi:hypothetical protein J41TS12_41520 [Paenibacillus antibioticophila]|uniref:Uncharacterized protein n=1 Tax=Paenibacillus antibioticophila TaxID=1274374 RepID=A0A919XU24_9BACL|nr:hypothetical protein [Paenibacillus antibioticophila]GIO39291.1 hypothetical protein J41TS12_41520 [Paenibacillus antibioticophila]
MKSLKIINWITKHGGADYKGLDINLFIPGTQIYLDDVCYVQTEEIDIPENSEIEVITGAEYASILENLPVPEQPEDMNSRMAANEDALALLLFEVAALKGGIA